MQIIAITGHANEGKTTTVQNLINLLCTEAQKRNYMAKESPYKSIQVVEITNLKLTLAFGEAGDYGNQVQENCSAATEINADILYKRLEQKVKAWIICSTLQKTLTILSKLEQSVNILI